MIYLTTYGPLTDESEIYNAKYFIDERPHANHNTAAFLAFLTTRTRDWNQTAQFDFIRDVLAVVDCPDRKVPDQLATTVIYKLGHDFNIHVTTAEDGKITQIDWEDEGSEIATHWRVKTESRASETDTITTLCSDWLRQHVLYIRDKHETPGTSSTPPG